MKRILYIFSSLLLLTTTSCDKFLDIEPEGKIIPKTTEDYRNILTSAYTAFPKHKSLVTLRTDEVAIASTDNSDFPGLKEIYTYNDLNNDKSSKEFPYDSFYKVIFFANQTILNGDKTMEDGPVKNQILGEAYALRALSYFDLVNLYAKPYNKATAHSEPGIVIENEVQIEKTKPKSSIQEVYDVINQDILKAKNFLNVEKYAKGENYRFSLAALYSLDARVSLYQGNYEQAQESADKALAIQSELIDLNADQNSSLTDFRGAESIMALEETLTSEVMNIIKVSDDLLASYDTSNDLRFANFYQNENKNYKVIKVGTGYNKVTFRTSELYMIKAETLAHLGKLAEAAELLNAVLTKRYKPEAAQKIFQIASSSTKEDLLTLIFEERFKEFSFEGHRWYDLRRFNQKKITHKLFNKDYILIENDPRYTLPFPKSARAQNEYL